MYQDFDKMPAQSRIWIYQADRHMSAKEENISSYFLKNAIQDWAAHGASLLASASVLHGRFVVIALDESQTAASGCSIDTTTRWLKQLGEELGIDFFDRSIGYEEGNEIKTFPVFKAKSAVESGVISSNTMVFNNAILILQELKSNWKIEANKYPFLSRYFKEEVV